MFFVLCPCSNKEIHSFIHVLFLTCFLLLLFCVGQGNGVDVTGGGCEKAESSRYSRSYTSGATLGTELRRGRSRRLSSSLQVDRPWDGTVLKIHPNHPSIASGGQVTPSPWPNPSNTNPNNPKPLTLRLHLHLHLHLGHLADAFIQSDLQRVHLLKVGIEQVSSIHSCEANITSFIIAMYLHNSWDKSRRAILSALPTSKNIC